jgi:hypothetical protein
MSLRQNVRNFLVGATPAEVFTELRLSDERGDELRAQFIREWISELLGEHLDCVAYSPGSGENSAYWADLWAGHGGGKNISLAGYQTYVPSAPEYIPESDPRFQGFLAACAEGCEIEYLRENWRGQ